MQRFIYLNIHEILVNSKSYNSPPKRNSVSVLRQRHFKTKTNTTFSVANLVLSIFFPLVYFFFLPRKAAFFEITIKNHFLALWPCFRGEDCIKTKIINYNLFDWTISIFSLSYFSKKENKIRNFQTYILGPFKKKKLLS